jgi:hypothetical protein
MANAVQDEHQRCRVSGQGKTKGLTMEPASPKKETKTAEDLAAMIHQDLSKMDGCPQRGVTVTVYGLKSVECVALVRRRGRACPQQGRTADLL